MLFKKGQSAIHTEQRAALTLGNYLFKTARISERKRFVMSELGIARRRSEPYEADDIAVSPGREALLLQFGEFGRHVELVRGRTFRLWKSKLRAERNRNLTCSRI